MSKKDEDDPPKPGFMRFIMDDGKLKPIGSDLSDWVTDVLKTIYEKEIAKMLAEDAKRKEYMEAYGAKEAELTKEAFEKLVAETPTEKLHDALRYGVDMAKIDADLSKVRDSRPSFVRDKAERLYTAAERLKETEGLDPESKAVLDDLLGAVRTSRTPKVRPGAERIKTFAEAEAEAMERRKREEEIRATRAAEETARRAREEEARLERMRRYAEEEKREAEARERRKREYEERKRAEEAEALRENKNRIMREWAALMAEEAAGKMYDLKQEVANVSVNTAKACVVVRCAITPKLAYDMLQIKGVKLVNDVFECSSEAMKAVKPMLVATFKDVQMIGVPKALPATKFDQLMAKLSKEDRASMYKLLARKHHTDVGGSHEMMVLINQVFRES